MLMKAVPSNKATRTLHHCGLSPGPPAFGLWVQSAKPKTESRQACWRAAHTRKLGAVRTVQSIVSRLQVRKGCSTGSSARHAVGRPLTCRH